MKKFYYVYSRACNKPLYRHKDKDSAIKEAIRLSKLQNKNFYVLAPVAHIITDYKNNIRKIDTSFNKVTIFKKLISLFNNYFK